MTRPSEGPAADAGGFLLNVNFVFIATVASYGLAFSSSVLLARALGDEGRGVTALYQAAVTLGFAFLSLGIATALVYYVARRELTGREAMEASLSITIGATALTAVGVVVAAVAFDGLNEDSVPFWLAIVAVPAIIQFRSAEAVLRAQARFGAMNLLEVSLPLSILACLGVVELAWGLTIHNAVIAWSLAFLAPFAFGYYLLGPSQWPRRLATPAQLSLTVRFGVQGQLGNLIQLLNYRLDAFLVLAFVDTAGVGLYAVAVSLSEGMWFIANSVSVVLQTNLTAGDEEYSARMTPVVCRNTLLVTAVASLAAAVVSPVVIPAVFGGDFEGSVLPFVFLLPGTAALAGTKILAAYVFSRGKPLINAQIAFVTLLITVLGDLILIPLFEVPGAAAAASFAYCCSLALTALAYRRLSGAPIAEALLPRLSDAPRYVDGVRSLAAHVGGRQ